MCVEKFVFSYSNKGKSKQKHLRKGHMGVKKDFKIK